MTLACDPEYESLMPEIRGWLTEAALFGFPPAMVPSPITVFVGRMAGKVLPHRHMVQKVPPEKVTRDPEVIKSLNEDDLCHDTGTLEGLAGMLDRMNNLGTGKATLNKGVKALWISHGTGDVCTSWDASKKFFDEAKVEDKEFKSYDDWSHQMHADLPETRAIYAKDVGDWILAKSDISQGPSTAGSAKL